VKGGKGVIREKKDVGTMDSDLEVCWHIHVLYDYTRCISSQSCER
jgi:hypothetical protein